MPSISRFSPPVWLARCVLAVLSVAVAASAAADPAAPPERGVRMQAVQAAYGEPAERHETIGNPPISRWDYPGFIVFFENDRVIHAVRRSTEE